MTTEFRSRSVVGGKPSVRLLKSAKKEQRRRRSMPKRIMSRIEQLDHEANEFAMHLLVPDFLLAKEDLNFDLADDDGLSRLAKKYGVSMGVMMIRVHQFRSRQDA